ncbi:uncharacterized protein LOC100164020 [Acyrthosiphon pisum]|uniref:tRNA (guanine(9)-N(1))-methyltransferase n=1 Tax=Acyrthosiphon pisum TaxID=7029 RepID=C4WX09_ACYPI|nr:uncharacterized protein LOC100164020 [Acyrthosiphon pisum]BAH72429.1 ACYPI005066 [Acyrthosiphon pisum]|eukprot:NP_001280413.1 uncharacterized protein LOC100164020 [Acyrthosiphon pisum]
MMNESPETVDIKPNHDTDTVAVKENGKRPLDQSEDASESQPKICKLDNESDANQSNTLSKRKRKRKLTKKQRRQMWLEVMAKRRETSKERKAQMRDSGVEIPIVKTKKMANSTCKQRIVLDMSYNDLMSAKDLCKCSNQLLKCYCVNRRMDNPMQLYVSSYKGKTKEIMAKYKGSEFWDIKYLENSFDKEFQKEEIVYLTSDSLNVLESIDENKVYIIGGLVNRKPCKGVSLKVANDLGIAHARLPIDEHITMKTRKMQTRTILSINHVFEIISKVVSGMSWKEALIGTFPQKKMFSVIDEEGLLEYENCSLEYKPKEEIECPESRKNENISVEN